MKLWSIAKALAMEQWPLPLRGSVWFASTVQMQKYYTLLILLVSSFLSIMFPPKVFVWRLTLTSLQALFPPSFASFRMYFMTDKDRWINRTPEKRIDRCSLCTNNFPNYHLTGINQALLNCKMDCFLVSWQPPTSKYFCQNLDFTNLEESWIKNIPKIKANQLSHNKKKMQQLLFQDDCLCFLN